MNGTVGTTVIMGVVVVVCAVNGGVDEVDGEVDDEVGKTGDE
jgi:hypothetical protein